MKTKNKFIILACACVWLLFVSSVGVFAQDIESKEVLVTDVSSEEVTDEMIGQYLMDEGVPAHEFSVSDIEASAQYTLGAEDVIEIVVLRHPEVSGEYVINSEGKVQYEFVGDIDVSGMTKDEAAEALKEELSTYIISPDLTVKILEYNSKIVYVIGEVGRPGKVFMRGDTITVREALIRAGLPMLSAKASKSKLITPSADKEPEVKKVNVTKLLYEGDLRENLVMRPGDTLFVPPTLMTKTMRILQPISAPISTAAGTGRTLTTGF